DNGMDNAATQATPLHEHGAFYDAGAALAFIDRAKDAMLCIGDMLQPNMAVADEDLHHVKRSQVAALFAFFGEALSQPIEHASEANDRIWQEARKMEP
ncbi:MAG: hypothetical protein Q7U24_14510, partial [Sulfurimicrobium sp.]|nr:hypothetical protein [Sulfurimicrobium sp.]